MKYPKLYEIPATRTMVDVFRGYNRNLRIGDGEFYDMLNLSSSDYPVLSSRPPRGTYAGAKMPLGMVEKDSLCYVDGTDFIINGYSVEMGLVNDGEMKTLISMGAYVIIMPDKKYINTQDLGDFGNIEASVTTVSDVSFSLCKADGEEYANVIVQSFAPVSPKNLDLWMDTSQTPHTLKQYSEANAMWSAIATTYIKISSIGIGKPFAEGDGVTISGIESAELSDLNGTMVLWGRGDDYIIVTGILEKYTTQSGAIVVERRMPNMDFIIESKNRLWGCRYGTARNGKIVNEIYASKLGDFKNWNCFMGISTDSYAVSVGTDGQFTGAITHLGYPIFFKENCMHKIYGNYPANFQIQTTDCRGVQKGSDRSLATVNEILYYKTRNGICAYDGSLPAEISSALGDISYHNAVGGSLRNKYYISMADESGAYTLFVYDTVKGMWHKEDDTHVKAFCSCRGDLCYIDAEGNIKTILGSGVKDDTLVPWMAETGLIGTSSPDMKYISRLVVRMKITVGVRVRFLIQYDSSDSWEMLFTMTGKSLSSFSVPIKPKRCDHFRLRIEGIGDVKIFSICKTVEDGSDIS